MRQAVIAFVLSFAVTPAFAQTKEPIALRDMGSFHVGGRVIEITGQPIKEVVFTPGGVPAKVDPNGKYQVEQMYVQYFLPQNRKGKLPLLLWHGGGLSGVTYETKPDGGDGWMHYFVRKGWDTYVSDAMERGRSGWSSTFKGEAMSLPFGDPWERFRMGPPGSWNDDPAKRGSYPGMQFPADAYPQFMKQGVPRWVTTDTEIVKAYIELVDKVCPCVVMVHSQSGTFGYKVLEARPDKVKAWWRSSRRSAATSARSRRSRTRRSPSSSATTPRSIRAGRQIRQNSVGYGEAFKAAGGSFDLVDLPDVGIKGNSHMIMMDKNSDQVADLIQKWLVSKGLAD